jgi:hypothetical protein
MEEYSQALVDYTIKSYRTQIEKWTEKLFSLLSSGGEQAKMDFIETRIQWRLNRIQELEASVK